VPFRFEVLLQVEHSCAHEGRAAARTAISSALSPPLEQNRDDEDGE
jgi:hypothetical protein